MACTARWTSCAWRAPCELARAPLAWASAPAPAPPAHPPLSHACFPPLLSPLARSRPPLVDHTELTRFHSDDYVAFLRVISPDNMADHLRELQRFNVGEVRARTLPPLSSL